MPGFCGVACPAVGDDFLFGPKRRDEEVIIFAQDETTVADDPFAILLARQQGATVKERVIFELQTLMAAQVIPGQGGAAEHAQEPRQFLPVLLVDFLPVHAGAEPEIPVTPPVGAPPGHQALGDLHLVAGISGIPPGHGLQPGEALPRRVGPEYALPGDIESAIPPVMEDVPLGLDVFIRGQSTIFRFRVPGADGGTPVPLGDEHIDMDRVPFLEFGNHADQSIDPLLCQSCRPFAGIDHVEHVLPLHLNSRHQQLTVCVLCEAIVGDVFVPERALPVGIDHVEVKAHRGVEFSPFTDQPAQAVEGCGILLPLEPGIYIIPGGIAMVVPTLLPTDEVNDLGDAACEVIGPADGLQSLFKRAHDIMLFLEHRLFGKAIHRVALHSEEQFEDKSLVVVPKKWRHDDIRRGFQRPAPLKECGLNGCGSTLPGEYPVSLHIDHLHISTRAPGLCRQDRARKRNGPVGSVLMVTCEG